MSDENILDLADSTTESVPPSQDPSGSESAPQSTPTTDPGQPVDLDSLARYRYQGRNLKDWESGYMRQQDYTQKTQALAQERRFMENLAVDLDRVKQSPHLAEQFRQIYPQKYHAYLRYVASETQAQPQMPGQYGQQPGMNQSQYARLDPAMEQRIAMLESSFKEREVAAIQAELDAKFKTLQEKYPHADEEAVVARAQALLAKMKEMDPTRDHRINDKQWDALWKSQHDRSYGLSHAQYQKQVQAQLKQAKKSADVPAGGGSPGHPPRQFRTLKEATAQALADADDGAI